MSAVPELCPPNDIEALHILRHFIGAAQLRALGEACRGEEAQFFVDKLVKLAVLVTTMPKVYEQDGKGDNAIVSLHYFVGGSDWFITERDTTKQQRQAFGYACLNGDTECAELGYIAIAEIIQSGAELDMYFTPRTLAAAKLKL